MRKKVFLCGVALFLYALISRIQWLSEANTQVASFEKSLPWELTLVNSEHPVSKGHTIETVELTNGQRVDVRIYQALQTMFDDMRAEGVYPIVASGYRSMEDQRRIMKNQIQAFVDEGHSKSDAETLARQWIAIPGTSEHQLGLGIDINADGERSTVSEVYTWLEENSCKYGFILRYPEGKTDITGINYEPWHYRYVGVDAALVMTSENLCLEEYIKKLFTSTN